MKYTDPDGRAAGELAEAAREVMRNPQQYGEFAGLALISAALIYVCTPQGQEAVQNAVNSACNVVSSAISNIKAKAAEKTKNDITMYHYSDTPPEIFNGALRAGSYVSPDVYPNGSEAREKLAIPRDRQTQEDKHIRYRYTIKLQPGEFTGAPNSLPGNIVDELDGKKGGGLEFITTVPKVPVECVEIPE